MDDVDTCGKGLAHNSVMPAKMADVIAALSGVLKSHLPTIDTRDEAGRHEHDAYAMLERRYDAIATEMAATAAQMAACRNLPMAQHIDAAFADPRLLETFERYVSQEAELLRILEERVVADVQMVESFRQNDNREG